MPDYRLMLEGWGFQRVQRRGNELISDCAFCGGKRRFYFNTEKMSAICFRGCFAGSAVSLIALIEGVDFSEARARITEGVNWFTKFTTIMTRKKEEAKRRLPFVLPQLRHLNQLEVNYLTSRRINNSLAIERGARGCDDLPSLVSTFFDCDREEAEGLIETFPTKFNYLLNRIHWPIYLPDGELHGIESRAIDSRTPKVCYPLGINLKKTLFFSEGSERKDWIIIVEGLLDALTVENWNFPVASTFSATISKYQSAILHRYQRIYIAYDADLGGEEGLISAIDKLYEGTSLLHVVLPAGKDPNDCTPVEFTKAFIGARVITSGHPACMKRMKRLKRKKRL